MARWTQNGKSERHVIRSGTRGQRLWDAANLAVYN